VLHVDEWPGHRAGQHVDIRLTAEDGYQAQRSYSIASAPEDDPLTLTVELVPGGEVSPYLVEEARPGDALEVRGPIGGYFVWDADDGGPLFLVAGGSGIVPLMAMVRHRAAAGSTAATQLLYSARTLEDVIYRAQLAELAALGDGFEANFTLTRARPPDWTGFSRRVDTAMLREVAFPPDGATAFVCGPTPFVEAVAEGLVEVGYEPERIKTERFGPTGG
jgi:ferredoxin-NADP reductase